jgi:hypothetical protein
MLLIKGGTIRDSKEWPGICFGKSFSMKSNRMWLMTPEFKGNSRLKPFWPLPQPSSKRVNLKEIPAPVPIAKPEPKKIVQDILVSTLLRIQSGGSAEVADAAAEYLEMIKAAGVA